MRSFFSKRAGLSSLLALALVACLAFATPWAEPLRRAIRPGLPLFVVLLATVSAVGQIVLGAVSLLTKQSRWRAALLPLSLGASALCMAFVFLPQPQQHVLRLIPLLGAALFAMIAAALQRRARERSEP